MSLKIRPAVILGGIAFCLALTLSTFSQTNSIPAQGIGVESDELESQYREVEVATFLRNNNIDEINPHSIAQQLLSHPESLEGRQQEGIKIDYGKGNAPTVIEYTIVGLADDSVRSIRTRVELQWQQDDWQILWVGSQFQCSEGRGHQDWSKELCS
ncbi:MAG: hypothetical protein WA865_19455 [Spirulinaceae cyanobacterium]